MIIKHIISLEYFFLLVIKERHTRKTRNAENTESLHHPLLQRTRIERRKETERKRKTNKERKRETEGEIEEHLQRVPAVIVIPVPTVPPTHQAHHHLDHPREVATHRQCARKNATHRLCELRLLRVMTSWRVMEGRKRGGLMLWTI